MLVSITVSFSCVIFLLQANDLPSTTNCLISTLGEPVPHWVELDAWAPTANGNAVLLPATPLDHGDWYVVLVRGLTDSRDGRLLPKAPGLGKAQRDFLSSSASGTSSSSSSSNSPWSGSSGGSSVDASGVGRPATLADDDVVVSQAQSAQNGRHMCVYPSWRVSRNIDVRLFLI